MQVNNMKELCAYVEQKRRRIASEHRQKMITEGERGCRPFTDKEYRKIVYQGKKSYAKARKFTHNAMWRDTHKKFEVQQLKYIK